MGFSQIIIWAPFSYLWLLRQAIGPAESVLDLGCGDGSLMQALSRGQNWKITRLIYTTDG